MISLMTFCRAVAPGCFSSPFNFGSKSSWTNFQTLAFLSWRNGESGAAQSRQRYGLGRTI